MTVEQLLFREERSLREVAVHYAYAVVFVVSRHQDISSVFYRSEMSRRDITAYAYY